MSVWRRSWPTLEPATFLDGKLNEPATVEFEDVEEWDEVEEWEIHLHPGLGIF